MSRSKRGESLVVPQEEHPDCCTLARKSPLAIGKHRCNEVCCLPSPDWPSYSRVYVHEIPMGSSFRSIATSSSLRRTNEGSGNSHKDGTDPLGGKIVQGNLRKNHPSSSEKVTPLSLLQNPKNFSESPSRENSQESSHGVKSFSSLVVVGIFTFLLAIMMLVKKRQRRHSDSTGQRSIHHRGNKRKIAPLPINRPPQEGDGEQIPQGMVAIHELVARNSAA